jgi:hypothetical protein
MNRLQNSTELRLRKIVKDMKKPIFTPTDWQVPA